MKDNEYKKISENQNLSEILISANIQISEDFDDQFLFNSDNKEIGVKIFKEEGDKCPRCWKLYQQLDEKNQLCDRCMSVINEN